MTAKRVHGHTAISYRIIRELHLTSPRSKVMTQHGASSLSKVDKSEQTTDQMSVVVRVIQYYST